MSDKSNSFLIPVKQFSGILAQGGDSPVWIHYAPFGRWSHPVYGVTTMTVDKANKMVRNFHDKVRGTDIMLDYEHGMDPAKGAKASGQIVDMQVRADGVWVAAKFTDTAKQEIASGEWKYFSPEFYEEWQNPMDDSKHEAVAAGGALTNKPWIKGMVPLNFSEVILGETTDNLRYKVGDDEELLVSVDGEKWRPATTDEVTEWEHSEPGFGGTPSPRLDEDEKSGDKGGSGSRRDTPPPEPDSKKEGSVVKLSKEAAEALGITLDAKSEVDEQAVDKAVVAMFSELKPLREAKAAQDREKAFSEAFPEEYEELKKQRDSRLATEAARFSERFERLNKQEGEGDDVKIVPTSKGFSGLALEKIQTAHKEFAAGNTEEGLKAFGEALDTITGPAGIVDYGEDGSSRNSDDDKTVPNDAKEAAKKFAEVVQAIQTREGGASKCSWGDALGIAARENPELAKKYSEASAPKV